MWGRLGTHEFMTRKIQGATVKIIAVVKGEIAEAMEESWEVRRRNGRVDGRTTKVFTELTSLAVPAQILTF